MKVLVIKTESVIPRKVLLDAQKEIEKCAASGILLLDGGYTYEVVDIDKVEVAKPKKEIPKCFIDLDMVTFRTKYRADIIRKTMFETIDEYGIVTVRDLYDLLDKPNCYTNNNYGWKTLRGKRPIVNTLDGEYRIMLPDPEYLG